eukprot:1644742-Amphidinium_carterae.1
MQIEVVDDPKPVREHGRSTDVASDMPPPLVPAQKAKATTSALHASNVVKGTAQIGSRPQAHAAVTTDSPPTHSLLSAVQCVNKRRKANPETINLSEGHAFGGRWGA